MNFLLFLFLLAPMGCFSDPDIPKPVQGNTSVSSSEIEPIVEQPQTQNVWERFKKQPPGWIGVEGTGIALVIGAITSPVWFPELKKWWLNWISPSSTEPQQEQPSQQVQNPSVIEQPQQQQVVVQQDPPINGQPSQQVNEPPQQQNPPIIDPQPQIVVQQEPPINEQPSQQVNEPPQQVQNPPIIDPQPQIVVQQEPPVNEQPQLQPQQVVPNPPGVFPPVPSIVVPLIIPKMGRTEENKYIIEALVGATYLPSLETIQSFIKEQPFDEQNVLIQAAVEKAQSLLTKQDLTEEEKEFYQQIIRGDFLKEERPISNYTINLMWVNRDVNKDNKYVFPKIERNKKNIKKGLLEWASQNPESEINFWYDGFFVTQEQLKATQKLVEDYNKTRNRHSTAQVRLRDVRSLRVVKQNPIVFSKKIPIYFRVDMLRLIASIEMIKRCSSECFFVYSDVDVKPISGLELFDQATIDNLKRVGLVMKKGGFSENMENSFHILSNQQPLMFKALNEAVIQVNIKRALHALEGKFDTYEKPKTKALQQIVYDSIPYAFRYLYHLTGEKTLSKERHETDSNRRILRSYMEELDKNKDNTSDFGEYSLPFGFNYQRKVDIPTKKVKTPAPITDYN